MNRSLRIAYGPLGTSRRGLADDPVDTAPETELRPAPADTPGPAPADAGSTSAGSSPHGLSGVVIVSQFRYRPADWQARPEPVRTLARRVDGMKVSPNPRGYGRTTSGHVWVEVLIPKQSKDIHWSDMRLVVPESALSPTEL